MRNNGKQYYGTVTFYLENGKGNKIWKQTIFAKGQGGLVDEVLRIKKNYEAKHGKSTCKPWKWTGPSGFVRLMDERKTRQKEWAQKNGAGA